MDDIETQIRAKVAQAMADKEACAERVRDMAGLSDDDLSHGLTSAILSMLARGAPDAALEAVITMFLFDYRAALRNQQQKEMS